MERGHIEQLTSDPAPLNRDEPITVDTSSDDGWISVEDRLPEEEQRILFVPWSGDVVYGTYFNNRFKDSAQHVFEGFDSLLSPEGVTHWMPLPEPPEES